MSDAAPSRQTPDAGPIPRPLRHSAQSGWIRWLPGLVTLRSYDKSWLRHDIVAGLVLTAMLVPVGIAYRKEPSPCLA